MTTSNTDKFNPHERQDSMQKGISFLEDKFSSNSPTDFFKLFKNHWEPTVMRDYKGAKAIFIDNLDQAFAIYNIPAKKSDVPLTKSHLFEINSNRLFEDLKKYNVSSNINVSSIIIAENFLADEIDVDVKRFGVISKLREEANLHGIQIEDYMSICSHGYSSVRRLFV